MTTAEDHKEAGNKAFASKDYDEAIKCYTAAIKLDNKNHVFFSNRSACYASKGEWPDAMKDAKECIKLTPSFIKGYYRLATAQIESNDLDAASSTIKQGMNIDPDNSQLSKLMRTVKAKKASAKRAAAAASSNASNAAAAAAVASQITPADSSISKEVYDLQNQLRATMRDFNIANANIGKAQKEQKMNEITKSELEKLPDGGENTNMYRGIGKMFMKCSREDVFEHLEQSIKADGKKVSDLLQKKDYLERRMKSQQQNIIELTSSPSAE